MGESVVAVYANCDCKRKYSDDNCNGDGNKAKPFRDYDSDKGNSELLMLGIEIFLT